MSVKIIKLEEAEMKMAMGGTLKILLTPENAGTKNFRFIMGYFAPGEYLRAHLHSESEEVYYVIGGQGTVYVGKEQRAVPVEPGMALYIPPGTIHRVINTGKDRLLIAFFVTPGKEPSEIVEL